MDTPAGANGAPPKRTTAPPVTVAIPSGDVTAAEVEMMTLASAAVAATPAGVSTTAPTMRTGAADADDVPAEETSVPSERKGVAEADEDPFPEGPCTETVVAGVVRVGVASALDVPPFVTTPPEMREAAASAVEIPDEGMVCPNTNGLASA